MSSTIVPVSGNGLCELCFKESGSLCSGGAVLVSTVDLHIHTYYSDGRDAPEAVLRRVAALGIKTVAITDHDNTNGVRQVQALAPKLGLRLIPAIELTCRWDQCPSAPCAPSPAD